MDRTEILQGIMRDITAFFEADSSGHDASHTMRVYRTALQIARQEHADEWTAGVAALLHDVDDYKISKETEDTLANAVRIMNSYGFEAEEIKRICHIIRQVSFSGKDTVVPDSLEGKVVQDADRLDAIGAIGIARAFAYGGSHHRKLYDPAEVYRTDLSKEEYRAAKSSTIAHFYEKLLLLKDMMNTETAKKIARHRHEFMVEFLAEFDREYNS